MNRSFVSRAVAITTVAAAAFLTAPVSANAACATGQKLGNPGFENGQLPWIATPGVIGAWTGEGAPRTGTRAAWQGGYGTAHVDTLSQVVSIPAGCTFITLSYYLKILSAETSTASAFDTLVLRVGLTVKQAYSNLHKGPGYVQRTLNMASYAGQTVTLLFTSTEDLSLHTSFVIDDVTLNAA